MTLLRLMAVLAGAITLGSAFGAPFAAYLKKVVLAAPDLAVMGVVYFSFYLVAELVALGVRVLGSLPDAWRRTRGWATGWNDLTH